MSAKPFNVHATAVVLGTRGILFVGPSGCGKSMMALSMIDGAIRSGHYAALVSDDQVMITAVGGRLVARAPPSIRGLVEIRGSGIFRAETAGASVVDFAVLPVASPFEIRLPEASEIFRLTDEFALPLLRLPLAEGQDLFSIFSRIVSHSDEF